MGEPVAHACLAQTPQLSWDPSSRLVEEQGGSGGGQEGRSLPAAPTTPQPALFLLSVLREEMPAT